MPADAEGGGAGLRHGQRVGVVEAERRGHAQPAAGEGGSELGQGAVRGFAAQDLFEQRARVFRVDVDFAALERAKHDLGATELTAVLNGGAGGANQGGRHLPEDHRFGEGFRTDDDLGAGASGELRAAPERGERREQGGAAANHGRGSAAKRSAPSTAGPVAKNAVTKASAGSATSVGNGPR